MPSTHEITSLTNLLIQRCTSITSLNKARQLHALILTSSEPASFRTPYLHNNILNMYLKCGSLFHAHHVFDKMPQRNVVSYNSLISAYARDPEAGSFGFGLVAQMRYEGFQPNGSTFTSLLQGASCVGDGFVGLGLHCQIVKLGFLSDVCVQTALVGLYSSFGDMNSANEVFGSAVVRDGMAWNCIISGNLKNNMFREGLCLFKMMLMSGVRPTEFTYSIVLSACARLGSHACGQLMHAQVTKTGAVDLPLQNTLVDMYSSCGDTQSAFSVFCDIQNLDLVSWNSMMAGYGENREGESAIELLIRLQVQSMHKPDEYTFAAVISAIQQYPASHYGEPLHALVIVSGCDKNVFVGSPLISMYFENGKLDAAERVFHSISNKDVVLWTEMITGYCKSADGESAVKYFYLMWTEGHRVDGFALSSALNACADLATLNQGVMLHCQAIKTGYDFEMSVCGSLIDTYAKIGNLQAAKLIFAQVRHPDLKCWNSMIGGYCHHGKAEEALKLFNEMPSHRLEADQVTYISLLSACSHCGLLERGKYLWNNMKEKGLIPGLKHYSCMVSLLSRAGLLEEAVKIINESQFGENHPELWRIILSSSVSSRDLSMGLHAAGKILEINAQDSATHSLMLKLFAAVGRWDGVMKIRKRVRELMLDKDPGLSWVETVTSVEVFSSGDQSHPRIEEVKSQLQTLRRNMKLLQDTIDYA